MAASAIGSARADASTGTSIKPPPAALPAMVNCCSSPCCSSPTSKPNARNIATLTAR
jgi:hypothetical protein